MKTWMKYSVPFRMAWLLDGESVRSAGDGSGACIVATAKGDVRVELGEWMCRESDGSLKVGALHPVKR